MSDFIEYVQDLLAGRGILASGLQALTARGGLMIRLPGPVR